MTTSVVRQIVELEHKSANELREIYNNLFPDSANCNVAKELLRPKIAYRLQELAFGGLSNQTKAKLEAFAKGAPAIIKNKHSELLPGTKICREHNGIMHEVEVTKDGFAYNGQKWNSLSAIATKITGTKWSGPKFFGLKG
jgi:hypothetical protein